MKYFKLLILLPLVTACSKSDISTYDGDRYVQFEKIYSDTLVYSFVFYPRQDHIEVPLELKLTGKLLPSAAKVDILLDRESTVPAGVFTPGNDFTFKAGAPRDTAYIKLLKAGIPDGDQTVYTIILDIEDGSQLLCGETLYSRRVIRISNTISKPDWWTDRVTSSLLGPYSDIKYLTFIENIYEGDLSDAPENMLRILAIQFKNFLKEQDPPIMDGDVTMLSTVPVIGS